jgi:hypothetical protein
MGSACSAAGASEIGGPPVVVGDMVIDCGALLPYGAGYGTGPLGVSISESSSMSGASYSCSVGTNEPRTNRVLRQMENGAACLAQICDSGIRWSDRTVRRRPVSHRMLLLHASSGPCWGERELWGSAVASALVVSLLQILLVIQQIERRMSGRRWLASSCVRRESAEI